ncbi:ATP-binding protein [Holdemanella biformis]|uniref:ATP-binding protein n=1 Tax=Holdemanella biformis TaxID=1735 RepID=UPI0039B62279
MEHDVSEKNLKEIISELLRLGYEGTYWDFKEDYTDCREDKLIDIICMANNIDGHQAYLIYGADDNGNVKGIEKTKYSRYTTKSVTEFLRSKPFAVMKVFINSIPKANITAETTTSKNKGILKSSTATIVTLKQPKRINIKKPVTLNEKDTISGF